MNRTAVYSSVAIGILSVYLYISNRVPGILNNVTTLSCSGVSKHLTSVKPIQGFHVLCIHATKTNENHPILEGELFLNGQNTFVKRFSTSQDYHDLRRTVEHHFSSDHYKANRDTETEQEKQYRLRYKQPWAFFSPIGLPLSTVPSILEEHIVFVFEGGQFVWPGIKIGHKRTISNLQRLGDVTMETISMTPLAFSVERFLEDDEIDIILELSEQYLKSSKVTLMDHDKGKADTNWRTSTTYFLPAHRHSVLKSINQRTEDLTKVKESHQEEVQILRYEETQKYNAHTDYFSLENHKSNPQLLEACEYGYKNRFITVFWYMSDVEEGGETIFPRFDGAERPTDLADCTKGLKVKPKKGKVIVFYSMLPNGVVDPYSLHGGCPPVKGTKYSGNKWIWNKPRTTNQ